MIMILYIKQCEMHVYIYVDFKSVFVEFKFPTFPQGLLIYSIW